MKAGHFQCWKCRQVLPKGDDAAALVELENKFPGWQPEDCAMLCGSCLAKYEAWVAQNNVHRSDGR